MITSHGSYDSFRQLAALDASIAKWKDIVNKGYKPSYNKCPLCRFNKGCSKCIIQLFTGFASCNRTSFYQTTARYPANPNAIKANNRMLTELYEIRRRYIALNNSRSTYWTTV